MSQPVLTLHRHVTQEVIYILEGELEMAKQGKTAAVMVVSITQDGAVRRASHWSSGRAGCYELLGGVTMAQHRLCSDLESDVEYGSDG